MQSEKEKKTALKQLREERRESIKRATAAMRDQRKAIKAIKAALAATPSTVPEIAAKIEMPTDRVLWFLATMKKYGQIVEDQKDGGFFRYALTE